MYSTLWNSKLCDLSVPCLVSHHLYPFKLSFKKNSSLLICFDFLDWQMLAYYIPFILHCHVKAMLDSGINSPFSTHSDHWHHIDSCPIRWLAIRTHFSQHSSSDGATNWKRANVLGDLVCFRPTYVTRGGILGLTCELFHFFLTGEAVSLYSILLATHWPTCF